MTAAKQVEKTPECSLGECQWCPGPRTIRREGAPAWEVPLMTVRCGCTCHRGLRVGRAPQA